MSLKQQRQQAIGRLIGQHPVANQPQLLELLGGEGITATQATVSRDLEELGVIKVRVPGGQSVYALPELETDRIVPFEQLRRVLGEWVGEVAVSANLVVLRTPPGLRPRRRLGARPQRARRPRSAPSPATTRCCASPPRRPPATSWPTACARSPGSGGDDG